MSRLPYVKPTIVRHQTGLANKFATSSQPRFVDMIEGVAVSELVERYGSPLFVFSERVLRQTYRDVFRAFSLRYPKVRFSWSYKTNYLDAVCRIFHQEGAWAEVVSEVEYEMARRIGVPGQQILFNGPYKPDDAIRRAIAEGAHLHLDHFDELYRVERIAEELDRTVSVGLRINMDTGIHPRWDRFGFNYDSGEAMEAIRRMRRGGRLQLAGLHTHIGTFILDPQAYGRAASKLASLALQARSETGWAVEYLDLGGGIASRATLHAQYSPGVDTTPPVDDYAESIANAILRAGFAADELPTLILESGRALVDEAGTLITRVVGNKRLANGARAVVVDAGVNVLFTAFWYRHDVVPAVDRSGAGIVSQEETVIYGPLCMNIDVVRPSVMLPPLEVGDPLLIRPVGAYNITQSMQFIRLRPAVVMIGHGQHGGQIDLIRRVENLDDVKGAELLPERLAV